jgi:chromosome segregation ATPase
MILDAADTARNGMRVLEAERGNFTQWHDDRVRDIDGLRHALSLVESEKSALAAAVAEQKSHETEFGDLQRQLFEYQAESANLRQENATLQSSLNALASSSSEQIETLRAELTSLCEVRQTNQILEDRLTRIRHRTARRLLDYKSHIAILQQQAAEAQRLDQLLPELEALREENNRLDKECYQRAASLDAARAALDQVESRYQGTIADLRQQLHRAEEELRSVLTLVPELRDDLAHCLADVARLPGIEQDLAHKQSLIQQLTQTLELVEADRANRGQQIALLHTHIEHQHARIAELETTLLPRRLVNLLKKS